MKGRLYRAASVCSGVANVGALGGMWPRRNPERQEGGGNGSRASARLALPFLPCGSFYGEAPLQEPLSLSARKECKEPTTRTTKSKVCGVKTAHSGSERCGFNYLAKPLTLFKVPAQALCNHIWIMLHLGLLCCNRKDGCAFALPFCVLEDAKKKMWQKCFLKNLPLMTNQKPNYKVGFQIKATACLQSIIQSQAVSETCLGGEGFRGTCTCTAADADFTTSCSIIQHIVLRAAGELARRCGRSRHRAVGSCGFGSPLRE